MLCAMLQYAVARGIDPRVHRHQSPRHGISIETGPLISDSSEALLQAAVEGAGIILTPDWQAGAALRDGTLVQILRQWEGPAPGGIYAVMPRGDWFRRRQGCLSIKLPMRFRRPGSSKKRSPINKIKLCL